MANKKERKLIIGTEDGQLMYEEPNWFDEVAWIRFGRALKTNQDEIDRERGRLARQDKKWLDRRDEQCWELGDWMMAGKDAGIKVRKLRQHVRVIFGQSSKQVAFGTLSNYMSVCRMIKTSRRREIVPFSMHVLVAKTRFTVKQQDDLLDYAEEKIKEDRKVHQHPTKCLSVRTFSAHIESKHPAPVKPHAAAPDEVVIDKRFVLKRSEAQTLKNLAKVLGTPHLIFAMKWMAGQYFVLHRDDFRIKIEAMIASNKAKKAEEERQRQYRWLVFEAGDKARGGRSWEDAGVRQRVEAAQAEFKAAHPLDTFVGKPPAVVEEEPSFEEMFAEAELEAALVEK